MTVERVEFSFFFNLWVVRVDGAITMMDEPELLKLEKEAS